MSLLIQFHHDLNISYRVFHTPLLMAKYMDGILSIKCRSKSSLNQTDSYKKEQSPDV